jgi:hypothetical protein
LISCVDPHGIRELNPKPEKNITSLNPRTRVSQPDYGVGYGIKYVDNDYWGYASSSSNKPKKSNSTEVMSIPVHQV